MNIPTREFTCMPLGELSDLIDGYLILNGVAEEEIERYIPDLK
jgi:hypothetical protein